MKKFVLLFLSVVLSVFANDGFGALGAGGIIIGKTDDIAMAKEVLDISYDKIKVDYEFVNESDKDITETIVFPLPPYLVGHPNPSHFGTVTDFKVFVNGKPVKFKTKVRAMSFDKNSKDITNKLRKIGFSDYDIIMAEENFDKMFESKKFTLLKAGIITKNDIPSLGRAGPFWENYVTYEWTQTFKAKQTLKVSHEYQPLPGGAIGVCYEGDIKERLTKDYCMDKGTVRKLDDLYSNPANHYGYPCIKAFNIEYVLKTANTWKDGIRDFRLIVRKRKTDEVVSLCFPGNFKKTSLLTYEVELKDFKPQQDLNIYFGNVDRNFPSHPESKPPIFEK